MMIDEHGRCSWQDMSPHFEPTAQERSAQELARWVRGYAGRGQAASLLWTGIGFVCAFFVGTQDAGKQRPYYGRALVLFAHFSCKTDAFWPGDLLACGCVQNMPVLAGFP